ncbi:PiggyBac transposable element-derived protein 2 [Trichinella zimbabwensis]|uniref:PiggyBac transposable element-derived protein 2 n=1 Tax=Trichinella zimbabwensis TaxID=268475 RepID=A0A0V1HYP7_9BILA|nr:PiggyBac transposable element-derived protein 2 [Trichinella zimbabwensis]
MKIFFTNDMFEMISEQPTLYAIQNRNFSAKFSKYDIEQLTGILMKMGMVQMSRYRLYWAREFRLDSIANRMSPFRFFEVMKYLHSQRLRGCRLMSEQALKVSAQGKTDFRTSKADDITAVSSYDNRRVTLTSTYLSVEPVKMKNRLDRKQRKKMMVSVPSIVDDYNLYLGGVDLSNMLSALYKIGHKSRKWTRRIFYWVIVTAAANG